MKDLGNGEVDRKWSFFKMRASMKESNSQIYNTYKSSMKSSRGWIILLQSLFLCLVAYPVASRYCIHTKANGIKTKETGYDKSVIVNYTDEGSVAECPSDSDFCFTLLIENSNKTYVVQSQGCWKNKGSEDCKLTNCIADKSPKAKNDSKFCCCSADLCNSNYTIVEEESESSGNRESQVGFGSVEHASNSMKTSTIVVACTFSLAVIAVAVFVFFRLSCFDRKSNSDSVQRIVSPPSRYQTLNDIDKLTIDKVIGNGRYGSVYLGKMDENREVAVKIFNHQNEQYFRNESEIYSLPFMDHPCLVKFIGAKERTDDFGKPEYLLVLSYSSAGCLQDYLRSRIINWSTLCKISQDLTAGLAHLHTAIDKGKEIKPCVAHRDLTSRNILIRSDGGCMICDFGFAICLKQGKYYRNGESRVAETTSLDDVGTLRYMAPEVLEGAVNLRDCETSLKQADVYGLGLILWEIASRCSDLFQGMEVPEYKLPYEEELNGMKPTMELMQVLVARHKARPLFPFIWKDTNPAIRDLKETIEYCWDSDADARLTTEGVEARLSDLPAAWEKHKANINSVSPIVNLTKTSYQSLPSSSSVVINVPETDISNEMCHLNSGTRENSENTVETTITSSPSDSNFTSLMPNTKNSAIKTSNSSITSKISVPLQPHQGYNPSIERNLMKEYVKDTMLSDNVLLEKGYKDDNTVNQYCKQNISHRNHTDGNSATTYAASNDTSERINRICHPIPYVQNVHLKTTIPNQNTLETKSFNGLFNCRNPRQERKRKCNQGSRSSLKGFFERRRTSKEHKILEEERQPLKASTSNGLYTRKSNEDVTSRPLDPNMDVDTRSNCLDPTQTDKLCVMGNDLHKDSRVQNKTSWPKSFKNGINGNNLQLGRDSEFLKDPKSKEYLSFSVYSHALTNGATN